MLTKMVGKMVDALPMSPNNNNNIKNLMETTRKMKCTPASASCQMQNRLNSAGKMLILSKKEEIGKELKRTTPTKVVHFESQSPSKSVFTNGNPNINYAGAKFSDPPSPNSLPKPPIHWMRDKSKKLSDCNEVSRCNEISNQLKVMLKVNE